jgi:glycerol-3-phosphate dehydrogenase
VGILSETFDVLVVGGGINGAGIARDAVGRGLTVLLVEQDDLASHTSSASTKLIHGGLRYLELLHFGLVRKALLEREVLMDAAPHISWPLRFVMPHDAHLRPEWTIRAGLLLYDNLARRRQLPGSGALDLQAHPAGASLEPHYRRGFIYSDGWTDDARLVVLNAIDAAERGATVLTRTRCVRVARDGHGWCATLDMPGGAVREVRARAVVNATGPWVSRFLREATPATTLRAVRLVKGSHIVVRQLFDHRFAYIFQSPDKRIVFAIPYEHAFTLLGTTDVEFHGDPADVRIEPDEVAYLCDMANRYFSRKIGASDVMWSYSGVRPLLDDESADPRTVTRDYALELEPSAPPLLTVYGGKITTYRKLAEDATNRLARALGARGGDWTAGVRLPGGDLPAGSFAVFLRTLERRYPWLPATLRVRYAHAYGSRVERLLDGTASLADLGAAVLPGLYEREIEYLRDVEWACSAEDILWRRSKLGLHLPADAAERLAEWLRRSEARSVA